MKKKLLFLFTGLLLISGEIFGQTSAKAQTLPDTTSLLLSYVENDSELKNLTLAAKKAALSYESAKIDTGFDVTLSSGTITLRTSDDGSSLTAKPSVKASLPQASNLSVSAQTNYSSDSSDAGSDDSKLSVQRLMVITWAKYVKHFRCNKH